MKADDPENRQKPGKRGENEKVSFNYLSGMIFAVGCSGDIEETVSSPGIALNNIEIKTR